MDDETKWLPRCVHYLNDAEASRVEQIIAANMDRTKAETGTSRVYLRVPSKSLLDTLPSFPYDHTSS